jgi:hypothetical protein
MNKNLVMGPNGVRKPRTTVLARTSSNVLDLDQFFPDLLVSMYIGTFP